MMIFSGMKQKHARKRLIKDIESGQTWRISRNLQKYNHLSINEVAQSLISNNYGHLVIKHHNHFTSISKDCLVELSNQGFNLSHFTAKDEDDTKVDELIDLNVSEVDELALELA